VSFGLIYPRGYNCKQIQIQSRHRPPPGAQGGGPGRRGAELRQSLAMRKCDVVRHSLAKKSDHPPRASAALRIGVLPSLVRKNGLRQIAGRSGEPRQSVRQSTAVPGQYRKHTHISLFPGFVMAFPFPVTQKGEKITILELC
jgi:hypothetical protein